VRYNTKGRWHAEDLEWVGSRVHLTETCEPGLPHLVIDVHTTAATEPDVSATTAIQGKLAQRGLAPASTSSTRAIPAPATSSPPRRPASR
jgi:hypothetical protein